MIAEKRGVYCKVGTDNETISSVISCCCFTPQILGIRPLDRHAHLVEGHAVFQKLAAFLCLAEDGPLTVLGAGGQGTVTRRGRMSRKKMSGKKMSERETKPVGGEPAKASTRVNTST